MSGSGKQMLLKILAQLSTSLTAPADLPDATRKLRAGLLLHGSTAEENYQAVKNVHWASSLDGENNVWRQGIATVEGDVFLADIVESLADAPGLKQYVLSEHPHLTETGLEAGLHTLWLIVSAAQMFSQLLELEAGEIDLDKKIASMSRHFDQYIKNGGV